MVDLIEKKVTIHECMIPTSTILNIVAAYKESKEECEDIDETRLVCKLEDGRDY